MRSSRVPEDMKGHALQAGLLDRVLELRFQVVERLVRRLSGKKILRVQPSRNRSQGVHGGLIQGNCGVLWSTSSMYRSRRLALSQVRFRISLFLIPVRSARVTTCFIMGEHV